MASASVNQRQTRREAGTQSHGAPWSAPGCRRVTNDARMAPLTGRWLVIQESKEGTNVL
jgi:hypothetical protein